MNGYIRAHSHESPNSRNRPYGLPIRTALAASPASATDVPFSTANTIDGDFDTADESRTLLDMARHEQVILLASDISLEGLTGAPPEAVRLFESLPEGAIEYIGTRPEARRLRDKFLEAGVVGSASKNDAHHVALATVARADLIVSWNFKHIVHVEKIRGFNAVNRQQGYPQIDIPSPKEVV